MELSLKSLGIDKLSVTERLVLVEDIWDSIAAEQQLLDMPNWHKDELDRRLAAYSANPSPGSSWNEVKARLEGGR
jgi:putative addiction module component (TIGR02574 family)